jgi:hypothetical protein
MFNLPPITAIYIWSLDQFTFLQECVLSLHEGNAFLNYTLCATVDLMSLCFGIASSIQILGNSKLKSK